MKRALTKANGKASPGSGASDELVVLLLLTKASSIKAAAGAPA